jgi:hypothetical protein
MLGGSVVLAIAAVASLLAALRAALRLRPPSWPALMGCCATLAYALAVRPWQLRWGARSEELDKELPGDELLPEGGTRILHAVTINASPEEVWPWVAQIGQDRGGFYSYEWLENLAGCEMRNAEDIHEEWQHREIGETVFLHPTGGLEVILFEPGRALGLRNWGTLVVEPDGRGRTRLLVRGAIPRGPFAAAYAVLMEIPHFIMERRMLLGIKERAERAGGVPREGTSRATSDVG